MAKVKIPRKVAGVKVPKQLRKQAKQALKLTESPAVRELAMAGLALAAEQMIARARPKKAAQDAGAALLDAAEEGKKALKDSLAALNLGEMVRAAAVEGARRFLEGFEEGKAAPRAAKAGKPAAPKAAKAKASAAAKPAAKAPKAAPKKAAAAKAKPAARKPAARKKA